MKICALTSKNLLTWVWINRFIWSALYEKQAVNPLITKVPSSMYLYLSSFFMLFIIIYVSWSCLCMDKFFPRWMKTSLSLLLSLSLNIRLALISYFQNNFGSSRYTYLTLLDVFSVTAASAIKGAISYLALPDFILCSFITLYIWNVVNIYVFNLPAFKSSLSMLFIDASEYTKWINLKCILCGFRGASRVLKEQVNWANPNSKMGTTIFKIFVWRAYFDIKQGL